MNESTSPRPVAGRSTLVVVFLTVFIDLVGFGIVIPILPLYADRYHPSPLVFGMLMASFSAMQFLFSPILGRLSDLYGRRPVILLSLAGSVVGYLLFAFADSIALLFLSRIFAGICGANFAAAQAVIADVTTPETRAKGMGMVGAAFGLGFIFGPAIGGILAAQGESWPGLFAAAFSAVAFFLALARLPETRPAGGSDSPRHHIVPFAQVARALAHPRLGGLLLVAFLSVFAFAAFESTFSQFLSWKFAFGPRQVSWWFSYIGVAMVLIQGWLLGKLTRRFAEGPLATVGMLLTAGGLAWLPFLETPRGLFVVLGALALGTGLTNPSLSSLVSRLADSEEQGAVLGVFQSMGSLGRIGGPMSGQFVYGHWPHAATYVASAGIFVLAWMILQATRIRLAAEHGR